MCTGKYYVSIGSHVNQTSFFLGGGGSYVGGGPGGGKGSLVTIARFF